MSKGNTGKFYGRQKGRRLQTRIAADGTVIPRIDRRRAADKSPQGEGLGAGVDMPEELREMIATGELVEVVKFYRRLKAVGAEIRLRLTMGDRINLSIVRAVLRLLVDAIFNTHEVSEELADFDEEDEEGNSIYEPQ